MVVLRLTHCRPHWPRQILLPLQKRRLLRLRLWLRRSLGSLPLLSLLLYAQPVHLSLTLFIEMAGALLTIILEQKSIDSDYNTDHRYNSCNHTNGKPKDHYHQRPRRIHHDRTDPYKSTIYSTRGEEEFQYWCHRWRCCRRPPWASFAHRRRHLFPLEATPSAARRGGRSIRRSTPYKPNEQVRSAPIRKGFSLPTSYRYQYQAQ